jgi:hypothetical protein
MLTPRNSVAIAWYIFALPLLSFPTAIPVTETTMNCKSPASTLYRPLRAIVTDSYTSD